MFVQTTCSINNIAYVGGANALGVLWRDTANNLWCWYDSNQSKWVISQYIGYQVAATGYLSGTFKPNFQTYNGQPYWVYGNYYIWYGSGWNLTSNSIGVANLEYQNPDNSWHGDTFWSCSNFYGTFIPRGVNKNAASNYNVTVAAPALISSSLYWTKDSGQTTPIGTYTPQGSNAGSAYKRVVGLLTMVDNSTMPAPVSYLQNDPADFTKGFGRMKYVSPNKWVIGTYNSEAGWYQLNGGATYPLPLPYYSGATAVTFANTKTGTGTYVLDEDDEKAPDLTVSFSSLTQGTKTLKHYISSVVEWRTPIAEE